MYSRTFTQRCPAASVYEEIVIWRFALADRKQDSKRGAGLQSGSKTPKDKQQEALDVSGVVYESSSSAGSASAQKNEGEGNRTAARKYNEATRQFVQSGRVKEGGERAKSAVEGSEKGELERAEKAGKSKLREEDPAVERKPRK